MTMKRILLPLRDPEAAPAALQLVADAARSSGATVRLVNVAPIPPERVTHDGRVVAYVSQEMERVERERRRALRSAEALLDGVPVETVVRFGDPAKEILIEAEDLPHTHFRVGKHVGREPGLVDVHSASCHNV